MASKPTVLPRWANVGGDVVTPLSGKQDIGWVPQERPPAEYMNWLALHAYNWHAWLDDLILSDSGTAVQWRSTKTHQFNARVDHVASIGGGGIVLKAENTNAAGTSFQVVGAQTGSGFTTHMQNTASGWVLLLQSSGTNGTALRAEKIGGGTGQAIDCQGISSFTGTLTVVSGGISVTAGGLTVVAGLSDFQAGAKTNEADIRHADKHTWVQVYDGHTGNVASVITTNVPYWSCGSGGWHIVCRLPLNKGDRLKEAHCYGYDNDSGNQFTFEVFKAPHANGGAPGAATQVGTTQTSATTASTNIQKLSITGLTESISGDDTVYYAIMRAGAVIADGHRIYAMKIVTDRNA